MYGQPVTPGNADVLYLHGNNFTILDVAGHKNLARCKEQSACFFLSLALILTARFNKDIMGVWKWYHK